MRPRFDAIDAGPVIEWWTDTYGGAGDRLARYRFLRGGRHTVWIAARDVDLRGLERIEGVGMPFVRTESRHWKPTLVAAVKFGLEAERNVVELRGEEVEAFFARRDVAFDGDDPRRGLPWRGYVIARYRGVPLGVGEWHGSRLVSCVPKGKRITDLAWKDHGGAA